MYGIFTGRLAKAALALSLAVTFTALTPCVTAAQQKQYKLASGTQGGGFYSWAALLAAALRDDNIDISVQSGNTAVSAAQLQKGALDLGMIHPLDALEALGAMPIDKSNIRTITMINPVGWMVIAGGKSGIKSVQDLRGKSIAWGQSGHMQSVTNELVFKALGIEPSTMKLSYISAGQGVSGLRDGNVQAVAYAPSFPSPQLSEGATLSDGISILGLSEEEIKKITTSSGGMFSRIVYPAGLQPELKQDLVTVAQWGQLSTYASFPEDVVYNITRALDKRNAALVSKNKAFENATPKTTVAYHSFPLHPGAAKYYREIGALK